MMKKIIFIASDVRSGSTLLDNLISNHPAIRSVGEMTQLTSHLNKGRIGVSWDWRCTCGSQLDECPVWGAVSRKYEQEYARPLASVDTRPDPKVQAWGYRLKSYLSFFMPGDKMKKGLTRQAYQSEFLKEYGSELIRILEKFCSVSRCEIVVDSSKTAEYFLCLREACPPDVELKLIHLVRDGRAVLFSKKKRAEKYKEYGLEFKLLPSIRGWWFINRQLAAVKALLDPVDVLDVRYEDLCRDLNTEMQRISDFAGISFCREMLYLTNMDKHNIGGTSHRLSWSSDTSITLDERWKDGLSSGEKCLFWALAGRLQRRLGY